MTAKTILAASATTILALLLSACGGDECTGKDCPPPPPPPPTQFEQYCKISGLPQSLRQTFILLDARSLNKATLATEFAEKNAFVRDLVLSLARGLSDPRERITILLVPTDGSPAQQVFSGCIPGVTQDEEAVLRADSSAFGEFFTGDPLKDLTDAAQKFQLAAVGGLVAAARSGVDVPEPQTGQLADTQLFAALRASRGVLEPPKGTVARYVIVTNLSAADFNNPDSADSPYKQGQDAGFKAGGDFGLAEVMIVHPTGVAPKGKDYLEGFLLAQSGRLVSYSSGKPSAGARAPKTIRLFEGEAAYPEGSEQITLRIADDGKGNLSSAWLTMLGGTNQSIPLTGQISCSSPSVCKVVSDDKGFAQVWSPQPGGEPEFINEMPFAGMRNFAFEIKGKQLKGKVSDPMLQIGNDGSKTSIDIKAETR